ncbi:hypothetical protein [Sedimenticola hydrogenitrophicus]|uniref:hypothetical protein n=1 Tax=Sedimenticola hydrogenitrophicus TaxID=2967975 RepID=UPI0021A7A15E|nr:hypothetical protein [Sedimenticola hydrogenitrophicus]
MWVIIQGIPPSTSQSELRQFLNRRLKRKGWLGLAIRRRNRLKSFSILRMTDRQTGSVECHGLAELETAGRDEETLRNLNGHQLHGRTVAVRKYYHRSASAHREALKKERESQFGRPERRRPGLYIEMLGPGPIDSLLQRR